VITESRAIPVERFHAASIVQIDSSTAAAATPPTT